MLKRTVFLTLVAALAVPATAAASVTVAHTGSTTVVTGDGDDDHVDVQYTYIGTPPISGNGLRITNTAGVTPGPGCLPEGTGAVVCPYGDGTLTAELGGGNDRFGGFGVIGTIRGQQGNDTLSGGDYGGELDGGEGDDTLKPLGYDSERAIGGPGTDTVEVNGYAMVGGGGDVYGTSVSPDVERLLGGSYEDYIYMGQDAGGGHTIEGGGGYDTVSYSGRSDAVKVDLGGSGTDEVGSDVESAVGGSGDDELRGTPAANSLSGGGGNDRIFAGDGSDGLFGGDGNDTLTAGAGDDQMSGAAGNDTLDGGPGEELLAGGSGGDTLRGGGDKDTVSYYGVGYYEGNEYYGEEYVPPPPSSSSGSSSGTSRPSEPGVTVTLDGVANDGKTAEGDNVEADVEVVHGSAGDDTITGGPGPNELNGYEGADRIEGGDGDDKVLGSLGDDILAGGTGKDEVRGGGNSDQVDGGPGEDLLIGQDDENEEVDGVDLIEGRDGERDAIGCPHGLSRVLADQHDVVDAKCALVERFTLGPPGSAPPPPPVGPSPLVRVHLKGTVVNRRGIARIRVSCAPAPVPCAGRLSLYTLRRRKLTRMGGTKFAVPAATTRVIRVKLNKKARRLVRRRRSVRTQVFVAHQDPQAKPIRVATVGLRRARR